MGIKWIFSILLSLITLVNSVPLEVVYTGEGCECPKSLGYYVNVPKEPPPLSYIPNDLGYKIDVPPVQAKAKVSYTFDFTVEEPKPPCMPKEPKLELYAKVDRMTLPKQDCAYAAPPPQLPLAAASPCKCGMAKPLYRYVNGNWILNKCKCGGSKCKCNLKRRKAALGMENLKSTDGTAILVESGSLDRPDNSIRRKRDLRRIFFRPHREELARSTRFVKHYHKNIPTSAERKQGLFDFDLLSNANPFKRKTRKVLFPLARAKIVKRDIKGEYDLLEKEREAADLTLPEIIQFMPETLQPDFKRGACQFGCGKSCMQMSNFRNSDEIIENEVKTHEFVKEVTADPTVTEKNEIDDNRNDNRDNIIIDKEKIVVPTFRKRNAEIYGYHETAGHQINQPDSNSYMLPQNEYGAKSGYEAQNGYAAKSGYDSQNGYDPQNGYAAKSDYDTQNGYERQSDYAAQNDYAAKSDYSEKSEYAPQNVYAAQMSAPLPSMSAQSSSNPVYGESKAAPSPCEQRKLYAEMRRAVEKPKYIHDYLGHKYIEDKQGDLHLVSSYSSVPDPLAMSAPPLHYAGDLEIPQLKYVYSEHTDAANPLLGAQPQNYPVQHISSADLDRIITDIIYRHPDFIDASSHYGGSLVDAEPYQAQQTKDFIKKLIDGRLSLLFNEPDDHYMHSYATPSYRHSGIHNPYNPPTSLAYLQTLYLP